MHYYIVNLSHAKRADSYITFWRPNNQGYAWPLSWAGQYPKELVLASLDYYNSGDNIAVPCAIVDSLGVAPVPGTVDGNAGPVVPNTAASWRLLLANVIATPEHKPRVPVTLRARAGKQKTEELHAF